MLGINRFLTDLLFRVSPKLYYTVAYFKHRGRLPDFKNPKDISEIIISDILSGEINQYAPYADKLNARDFINDLGLGEYLPELYGVWDSVNDIHFDSLPCKFALKTNHGCGGHYICFDKSRLDVRLAKSMISKALNTRFGKIESHYNLIKPKCFAEEFIDDGTGGLPVDIKFMCCDGEIKCILCCVDRTKCSVKLLTYDSDWNKLDYIRSFEKSDRDLNRPEKLDDMLKIAKTIAQKFKHVRVDLYSLPNGKIYIGELTFTPEGGLVRYFTNNAVDKLGHS